MCSLVEGSRDFGGLSKLSCSDTIWILVPQPFRPSIFSLLFRSCSGPHEPRKRKQEPRRVADTTRILRDSYGCLDTRVINNSVYWVLFSSVAGVSCLLPINLVLSILWIYSEWALFVFLQPRVVWIGILGWRVGQLFRRANLLCFVTEVNVLRIVQLILEYSLQGSVFNWCVLYSTFLFWIEFSQIWINQGSNETVTISN